LKLFLKLKEKFIIEIKLYLNSFKNVLKFNLFLNIKEKILHKISKSE